MRIDLAKATEAANTLHTVMYTKIADNLSTISNILAGVDQNNKTEEMFNALGKMEQGYNDEYLPVVAKNKKILAEELPELYSKINSIEVDTVQVKTADVKERGFDMSAFDGLA